MILGGCKKEGKNRRWINLKLDDAGFRPVSCYFVVTTHLLFDLLLLGELKYFIFCFKCRERKNRIYSEILILNIIIKLILFLNIVVFFL